MSETEPGISSEVATDEQPSGPQEVNCRHCGQPNDVNLAETPDWLCTACEHYQDSMTCPTCGGQARISLMPAELAPPVHEPTRRRRVKE